ncbi:MAG: hypothetical protein HYZ14_18405 [Bacteroidetes bacterium]|nr:hypothetical protein [Bacteroidota bacterium]
MKHIFSLLAGLLFSAVSMAQSCNKYLEKGAVDDFTNEPAIFSQRTVFSQPTVVDSRSASFRVIDNNRFFFHLTSGRSQDLVFGSDIILVFANDEELTLQIEQMSKIKEGSEFITHANCRVYTKADAERFYTDKLVKIRLLGSRQEYEIDPADQTRILAGALCIAESVGVDNLNFDSERETLLLPDGSGASFISGSGSTVIMSGTLKCEFEKDTLNAAGEPLKLSKLREIGSSPHKLMVQLGLNGDKLTLYLSHALDLGNANAKSYVLFKFKDGAIKTFKHTGEPSNSEKATFQTEITLYKSDFMNNDLAGVRISLSEYFADVHISSATLVADFLRYCF